MWCKTVVARYQEDVSWAQNLHEVMVYNKGDSALPENLMMIPLENKGREAHTYLHHIIENYEDLMGHILFLQGWPFDHCYTIDDGIPAQEFMPLCEHLSEHFQCPENHPSVAQDLAAAWQGLFDCQPPEIITFGAGAMFKVSAERIRSRSKAFYETALELSTNLSEGPWAIERLWPYIFGASVSTKL